MRAALRTGLAAAGLVMMIGGPLRADVPRRLPPLVDQKTDEAIQKGLKYLASRQAADGSWRETGAGGYTGYPVAMTALAGMAMAGSGSTPVEGPFAPNLSRATIYLLKSAQPNGLICRPGEEESRSMYGHGFSMLFLSQMMGMEGDNDRMAEIRRVLQNGAKQSSAAATMTRIRTTPSAINEPARKCGRCSSAANSNSAASS